MSPSGRLAWKRFTPARSSSTSTQPESVANILARYADLEEQFPEEFAGAALPYLWTG